MRWFNISIKETFDIAGFSQDCLDLFQTYVDYTGDVQTAAVALIQCIPNPETSKDPRLQQWIDTYRDLLDTWKLWHQRYQWKFEIFLAKTKHLLVSHLKICDILFWFIIISHRVIIGSISKFIFSFHMCILLVLL